MTSAGSTATSAQLFTSSTPPSPPYLTALYSIPPGTNSEAYHILRAVVVAEMLHLTLAANILNAACRTARRISTGGRFRLHGCDVNP